MNYLLIILFILTIKGAYAFVANDAKNVECSSEFVRYNNSCYFVSHDTETWADAMVICIKLHGGYLAEVTDMAENNFIRGLIQKGPILAGGSAFLGGNDLVREGVWAWVESKTDLVFKHYMISQPNNAGLNENCLSITLSGYWDDVSCHTSLRYVCEK